MPVPGAHPAADQPVEQLAALDVDGEFVRHPPDAWNTAAALVKCDTFQIKTDFACADVDVQSVK